MRYASLSGLQFLKLFPNLIPFGIFRFTVRIHGIF